MVIHVPTKKGEKKAVLLLTQVYNVNINFEEVWLHVCWEYLYMYDQMYR